MVNGGKGGICTYLLSIGIELRKEGEREGVSFGDARFECPPPFASPLFTVRVHCALGGKEGCSLISVHPYFTRHGIIYFSAKLLDDTRILNAFR